MPKSDLLDPDFIRRLEQLQLASRRLFAGRIKGERRSKHKGVSIEFADYRDYARGDDLRFLDWNIFGRLDRLFLKIFLEEQDLFFYVMLDASRSMNFGEPSKLLYAKKLAAALAYIGLARMDRVGITCFTEGETQVFSPTRGRRQVWPMLRFLDSIPADGGTSLSQSCREFALRIKHRGIVVLLSDLLDPEGFEDALKYLVRGKFEVYLVHILTDEELKPTLQGHLELLDSETDERVEITISPALLKVYERTVNGFCERVRKFSLRYGVTYLPAPTSLDPEDLILRVLRRQGLLK